MKDLCGEHIRTFLILLRQNEINKLGKYLNTYFTKKLILITYITQHGCIMKESWCIKKWQTKSYLLNDFINIQLFKMKINLYCQKFNQWFFREEATTKRHEESFGGRRVTYIILIVVVVSQV